MQVQYVTNEQGQRTGVLLDVDVYQRLMRQQSDDPDLLTNMSRQELEALAASSLAVASQARLDELLEKQHVAELTESESYEIDELIAQADQLTILKTRARYTLAQLSSDPKQ